MTLGIALELDHDAIRLLRRAADGRTELGALRLDDPNFDARIAALRNGICGEDTDVEVVLPRSLVLFVDVGDSEDAEVEARVAEETPCTRDEIIIGRNGALAAAVERATLEEARDFAREHGFRPAAFAARPGNGADGDISFRYEPVPPPEFRSHRQPPGPEEEGAAVPHAGDMADAEAPPAPSRGEEAGLVPVVPVSESPDGSEADALSRTGAAVAAADPPGVAAERSAANAGAGGPAAVDGDAEVAEGAITWRTSRQNGPATSADQAEGTRKRGRSASWPKDLDPSALPQIPFRPRIVEAAHVLDPSNVEAEQEEEEAHAPVTFRHAELDPEPAADDRTDPAPGAQREIVGEPRHRRPARPDAAPVPAPSPPVAAPGKKAAPASVPSLATPSIKPARSEADALTIFGARGAPAPRARSFTMLHAAAALLAAGVLLAAYALFQDDVSELEVVNLQDATSGALDPLIAAGGDSADAVEQGTPLASGDPGTELAALEPTESVAPAPGPANPARDRAIETPQSDLATPVALPDPIELRTPDRLSAPVLPARPDVAAPGAFTPPPPPGTVFDMDERGLVRPTEDGAMSPQGVMVHSGQPETVPPEAALTGAAGLTSPDEEVAETQDDAALGPVGEELVQTAPDIPRVRPRVRPDDPVAGPVVTALAADEDTPRPLARPASVSDAVAASAPDADPDFDELERAARSQTAAAGAGIAATAPRAAEPPPPEPEGRANVAVQPSMPTSASVAERATVQNALRLNRVNLIGVYGSASDRRALIRLPTGRYIKVKVGDRVDGGRVASIQNSRVEYVKGGRSFDLRLPSG